MMAPPFHRRTLSLTPTANSLITKKSEALVSPIKENVLESINFDQAETGSNASTIEYDFNDMKTGPANECGEGTSKESSTEIPDPVIIFKVSEIKLSQTPFELSNLTLVEEDDLVSLENDVISISSDEAPATPASNLKRGVVQDQFFPPEKLLRYDPTFTARVAKVACFLQSIPASTPFTSSAIHKPMPLLLGEEAKYKSSRASLNKPDTNAATSSTSKKRKSPAKAKNKLCKSTNLKRIGNSYFGDDQKRITNYFEKTEDSDRVGYFNCFNKSVVVQYLASEVDFEENISARIEEITADNTPAEPLKEASADISEDPPAETKPPPVAIIPKKVTRATTKANQLAAATEIREKAEAIKDEGDPTCFVDQMFNKMRNDQYNAYNKEMELWMQREDAHCDTPVIVKEPKKQPPIPAKKSAGPKRKRKSAKLTKPKSKSIPKLNADAVVRVGVCPKYKIIEGTGFAVDAFRYGYINGVTHYFLTHFHADHYIGLKKSFNRPIIMSAITSRLVKAFINVSEELHFIVELHKKIVIDDIEITALDANHCPGALLFLFKLPNGKTILHTGDFRATPEMEEYPEFWNNDIDTIYLDTTYLSSKYAFQSQYESIVEASEEVSEFIKRYGVTHSLIICGSYIIGKEKVWKEIAAQHNFNVWTEPNRRKALDAINDPQLSQYLVDDPTQAKIHVLPLGKMNYKEMNEYCNQVSENLYFFLILKPSGWEHRKKTKGGRGRLVIRGIEYSEHSSYTELERFVRFLRPLNVISTVPYGNSNQNKTPNVPQEWLTRQVKPIRKSYQPAITSFINFMRI